MSVSDNKPRIEPLPESEWDERSRRLLTRSGKMQPSSVPVLRKVLIRNPDLFEAWDVFQTAIYLDGQFTEREFELVVIRVAVLLKSTFTWAMHYNIALDSGLLSEEEIFRVATGPDAAGWLTHEAALIRSVDDLHSTGTISDASWAAIVDRYDTKQLIELPLLIGEYFLFCFAASSFKVQAHLNAPALPSMARNA